MARALRCSARVRSGIKVEASIGAISAAFGFARFDPVKMRDAVTFVAPFQRPAPNGPSPTAATVA